MKLTLKNNVVKCTYLYPDTQGYITQGYNLTNKNINEMRRDGGAIDAHKTKVI